MVAYKGVNSTKFDAPGGDNIIPDGYIKAVEKVWIDYFTMSTNMSTADTLQIATIPANKKITGVEVYFDALTPTSASINVGTASDPDKFIDDGPLAAITGAAVTKSSLQVVSMNNEDGFAYVTTEETDILLSIGITAITATSGTGSIKTIVRYT
jgi:hypothetical protein